MPVQVLPTLVLDPVNSLDGGGGAVGTLYSVSGAGSMTSVTTTRLHRGASLHTDVLDRVCRRDAAARTNRRSALVVVGDAGASESPRRRAPAAVAKTAERVTRGGGAQNATVVLATRDAVESVVHSWLQATVAGTAASGGALLRRRTVVQPYIVAVGSKPW
jgi:hypothetical protein